MNEQKKIAPNFMIIGGMKCATSTLHDQLAIQNGFYMTTPKEPNFFSNDENYEKGPTWYANLYQGAGDAEFIGESSTHYTKFPTYPKTIDRIIDYGLADCKFIYIMREPVARLVSHYIHEWSQGIISCDIDSALEKHPELIDYSRYFFQLSHFLEKFPAKQILLVYFEHLSEFPQVELQRICNFLGYQGNPVWDDSMERKNVSSQRIKKFPFYEFVIESTLMANIRRAVVPKKLRNHIKSKLTMNTRPELSQASVERLEGIFDEDLGRLGSLLGYKLDTKNYKEVALRNLPNLV